MKTYPTRGKTFIRGKGNYLFDEKGQKYLDCMINYGVNIFGHQHPEITQALKEQLDTLSTLHGSFANDVRSQAAEMLVKQCGGKLAQVYFANSGTEAIEAALKFAVSCTGKRHIVAMEQSYHGKTLGSLSVTYSKKYRTGLEPLLWNVDFVPFGDIERLTSTLSAETAAVILEPIQGESGILLPPADYLKKVENLCREKNILFIADEIQTGTGRTGKFLATHHEGVKPDIICLGKGIGGGIPVGVTLVSQAIAQKIPKGFQTSTFGSNPLACRGIIETLKLLMPATFDYIYKVGNYFMSELRKLQNPRIVEIRGRGLMVGVEVTGDRNQVLKSLQEHYILACPAGENVVRFLPPYTITEEEVGWVVNVLDKVLKH